MTPSSLQAHQDIAQTHLQHAYVVLAGDKESVRAAYWKRVSQRGRKMILWSAGLDVKKSEGTLQSFDALERGRMHCEARRIIKEMELILRCAQGGELPSRFPPACHESDGIAA
ncbi:hypothetical protein [Collimonas silvisoli]|uniref:hypothetical protein n=1 Tax=Collimonas silvisoli TaxID=2825884 RepID=UPI001B8B9875|nr:hypothetical protein [Collimonas silvisoli]